MWISNFFKMIKETARTPEHRLAWAIAIVADTLQIVALAFFRRRRNFPLDTGLDLVVAAVMTKLLGWHWAFLPTFAAELYRVLISFQPGRPQCSMSRSGRLPPMSQARFIRKMARKSCHQDLRRRGDNWRVRKNVSRTSAELI